MLYVPVNVVEASSSSCIVICVVVPVLWYIHKKQWNNKAHKATQPEKNKISMKQNNSTLEDVFFFIYIFTTKKVKLLIVLWNEKNYTFI